MSLRREINADVIRQVSDDLQELARLVQGVWRDSTDPEIQSRLNGVWNRLDTARSLAQQAASLMSIHERKTEN
jgi:hypothetical protein